MNAAIFRRGENLVLCTGGRNRKKNKNQKTPICQQWLCIVSRIISVFKLLFNFPNLLYREKTAVLNVRNKLPTVRTYFVPGALDPGDTSEWSSLCLPGWHCGRRDSAKRRKCPTGRMSTGGQVHHTGKGMDSVGERAVSREVVCAPCMQLKITFSCPRVIILQWSKEKV